MANVKIPTPLRRRGQPVNIMEIRFTRRHGLGWALFRPGTQVAFDFGGFAIPEYVTSDELATWGRRRQHLYDRGEWINLGRYDYLLDVGWFPSAVRRLDLAGCARELVPNGPTILAVLRGTLRNTTGFTLKPSMECPIIDEYAAYHIPTGPVAIRWAGSRKK